jgi:hypothetical protein
MWRWLMKVELASALLLCALMSGRTARAQAQVTPEQKAAAEAVFEEGLRLIKQGNFEEACPKFEMSQRIEPGVGTMLYLAECYEKTNRTASSWAMFREAASLAEASNQAERVKVARARAARLEPRLAWLNIALSKEALAAPGLQLKRNGVSVATELAGTPTPVDPGEVLVEASAPGRVSFSTKVNVAPKGHAVVSVPLLAVAAESSTPPPSPAPPLAPSEPPPVVLAPRASAPVSAPLPQSSTALPARSGSRSIVPWVVGGAGVVGLGVGSVFGVRAMTNADDARAGCPDGLCNEKSGQDAASDARRDAKVSNVAFALGGLALAAGVVLYFTLPTKTETQLGVATSASSSGLVLSLRGQLL